MQVVDSIVQSAFRVGVAIAICLLPGFLGSTVTSSVLDSWYRDLEKPWFNPPDWMFGPVWTFLYILMGIVLYLIWANRDGSSVWKRLIGAFVAQLALNTAWTFAFFGLESPLAGLIVIVPLWATILATAILAWRFSQSATVLFVPYLGWVTFALLLNFEIWRLN